MVILFTKKEQLSMRRSESIIFLYFHKCGSNSKLQLIHKMLDIRSVVPCASPASFPQCRLLQDENFPVLVLFVALRGYQFQLIGGHRHCRLVLHRGAVCNTVNPLKAK